MEVFIKTSYRYTFGLLTLLYILLSTYGCHYGEEVLLTGRKKRATMNETERTFISACLVQLSSRGIDWNPPVDYAVLHSNWYQDYAAICSTEANTDTAECWLEGINDLISASSDIIEIVKECIVEYTFARTEVNYTGTRFPSNREERPDNDDLCPEVGETEYMDDFGQEFNEDLDDDTDETVMGLQTLIGVLQSDMICPNCGCGNLSLNAGTLEEYDYDNGLSCAQCWPTRLSSLTRSSSRLARSFSRSAIRVSRLSIVDTCPGSFIDPDDPSVETSLDLRVDCFSNRVTVRVDRCTLVNLGIDLLDEFVIADNEEILNSTSVIPSDCVPDFDNVNNRNDVRFTIRGNLASCGAAIKVNQTHTSYTYTLRTNDDDLFSGLVNFVGDVRLRFQCVYRTNYNVTSGVYAEPLIGLTQIDVNGEVGIFEVKLTAFRDDEYMMPFTTDNQEIIVPDLIYVSVDVNTPANNLLLVVSQCVVSNSFPINPMVSVFVIQNGCPIPNQRSFLVDDTRPGRFQFGFSSFTWVPDVVQQLCITCFVRVCNAGPSCQRMNCAARKRRDIDMLGHKDDFQQVSLGPIMLKTRKNTCTKNNGGCSHICTPSGTSSHFCSCRHGFSLMPDGRNCFGVGDNLEKQLAEWTTSDKDKQATSVSSRETFIHDVPIDIFLILICFIIFALLILMQKRNNSAIKNSKV